MHHHPLIPAPAGIQGFTERNSYSGSPLSRGRAAVGYAMFALMMLSGQALAQQGDLEFGRYLATECLTCHRSPTAGGAIPNIFGMVQPKFIALIKAYRDKQLPNPVMQSVASRLKDDEIEALAYYFAVNQRP